MLSFTYASKINNFFKYGGSFKSIYYSLPPLIEPLLLRSKYFPKYYGQVTLEC